jgi:maltose alpha-D-glucosyltransferase/alpha-amylase
MKRIIAVRRGQPALGRGAIAFLRPANERILAYVRRHENVALLLVHNLAASAQSVELNLKEFAGSTPVELLGDSRFATVAERPYVLTLAPYGYYWLNLVPERSGIESYGIEQTAL